MVTWPSSLPDYPLKDGYSETMSDNIIRTKMDNGPDKIRRRATSAPKQLTVSYILDKSQMVVLDNFYSTTLKSGSLTFSYTHPRTDIVETVRFLKTPEYRSQNGKYFRAGISLEVLP